MMFQTGIYSRKYSPNFSKVHLNILCDAPKLPDKGIKTFLWDLIWYCIETCFKMLMIIKIIIV